MKSIQNDACLPKVLIPNASPEERSTGALAGEAGIFADNAIFNVHPIVSAPNRQTQAATFTSLILERPALQAPSLRPRSRPVPWLAPVFALASLTALDAQAGICDPNGKLQPASQNILNLTAAALSVPAPEAWSLEAGNEFAQRFLSRPKGQERLSDGAKEQYRALYRMLTPGDRELLTAELDHVGLVAAIEPPAGPFDYILLNGSTAHNVRRRVHFLAEAITKGTLELLPDTKIIFLDGERPLFTSETPRVLLDPSPFKQEPTWVPPSRLPQDERAMDEMIWQQMLLPKKLRRHGILFVHAQKQEGAARAETADCVAAWVRAHRPGPGRALVISNNPTIEYQKLVTERLLEKTGAHGIEVACMGPEAELGSHEPAVQLGLLLDAFAGTLYRSHG